MLLLLVEGLIRSHCVSLGNTFEFQFYCHWDQELFQGPRLNSAHLCPCLTVNCYGRFLCCPGSLLSLNFSLSLSFSVSKKEKLQKSDRLKKPAVTRPIHLIFLSVLNYLIQASNSHSLSNQPWENSALNDPSPLRPCTPFTFHLISFQASLLSNKTF